VKIVVGIKHVPDTETRIKVGPDGRSIDETGVKWVISPYDEFALEEALRIRDGGGGGEVVAVSAGREAAQASLRQALAMGADRAVLVADPRLDRAEALLRAAALAAVVRSERADLVLLGKYGVGTDEWLTGPMLAELLDWPHASAVCRLELGEGRFCAEREVEGAQEVHEGLLPAVITCEKGLNEPRYPSLKGIMQAKKKPLETKGAVELGLDGAALDAPRLVWESLELPPARAGATMLDGTAEQAAGELARLLREVAKVI
jgi:electron transfer flavoprotein beta subunit